MNLIFESKIEIKTERFEELVTQAVEETLNNLGFSLKSEIGVIFTDDAQIREINKEFREIDKSTDVLSFPLNSKEDLDAGTYEINHDTDDIMLGDVVISIVTCERQGEEYGHGFNRELCYLTVHSILHLLGYDHDTDEDKLEMRKKEEEILTQMGLGE